MKITKTFSAIIVFLTLLVAAVTAQTPGLQPSSEISGGIAGVFAALGEFATAYMGFPEAANTPTGLMLYVIFPTVALTIIIFGLLTTMFSVVKIFQIPTKWRAVLSAIIALGTLVTQGAGTLVTFMYSLFGTGTLFAFGGLGALFLWFAVKRGGRMTKTLQGDKVYADAQRRVVELQGEVRKLKADKANDPANASLYEQRIRTVEAEIATLQSQEAAERRIAKETNKWEHT